MAGNDRIPGLHLFGGHPPLTGGTSTGRVFWVGNAATYVPGGIAGVDDIGGYGQSPQAPFATLDYAIGQCVGGRGDTIFVLEGHAETVAGTIAADVAGIKLRGLGVGANRPTLTFDGTADLLEISAANIELTGFVFVCNIASLVRFVTLTGGADGAWIHHCLFREGSATGLSMVEWTGAADDVVIEDNAFYAPTAGNYDEAILIASTPTRGVIRRNLIIGDWDEGGINNAAGNVATLFEITENHVQNLLTNVAAINLDSAVTGMLTNNRLFTDTQATALDSGSMGVAGNLSHAPGSDTEAATPLPVVDSPTNFVGVDDANNDAATTNVVANADGSLLERLEYIQSITASVATNLAATSGTYMPGYGYFVTKVGDIASDPDDLFTVTGKVLITLMVGEVTSVIATSTSIQLQTSTNAQIIAASTQITTDAAGTLYIVAGDTDLGLNGGGTPGLDMAGLATGILGPFMVNDDRIYQDVNSAGTGTIQWDLWYLPLEASATVASSA